MTHVGKVYLVGAGTGDPELITLRGAELLRRADEVLYDYLVNPQILTHARPQANLICLGSHGRASLWPAEKIHARLVDSARAGLHVVRLKSGDPMIFGRAAGEIHALNEAGIPFEIVPGITAALSAAGYAGVPLTDRDRSSAVAFVTGQENPDKSRPALDYQRLAQFPGTLVVYMGVTTAQQWTSELMEGGMDAGTPVRLIRRCSWPDQSSIQCRLDEVADRVTPYAKFPPPVIAIVGDVTQNVSDWSSFQQRPLFGVSVLVTRPRHQAESLSQELQWLGAEVVLQPALEIMPPESWSDVDRTWEGLEDYEVVVFASANGVEHFMRRGFELGYDARRLAHASLIATGPATADALREFGLRADHVPEKDYRAEGVVELLSQRVHAASALLVRANRGRDYLEQALAKLGMRVERVVAYRSVDVERPAVEVAERLERGALDWVLATSSASAQAALRWLGPRAHQVSWLSISAVTTQTLREAGIEVDAEATEASVAGLVAALCAAHQTTRPSTL